MTICWQVVKPFFGGVRILFHIITGGPTIITSMHLCCVEISMASEKPVGLVGDGHCGLMTFFALYTQPTSSVLRVLLEMNLCNDVTLRHTPIASAIMIIPD